MAKKISTGGQIARYIRGAFNKAKEGEIAEARSLWDKAVAMGWTPSAQTEKGFKFAVANGERDRGIRPVQNGTESR